MNQILRNALFLTLALAVVMLCAWIGDASTGTLPGVQAEAASGAVEMPADVLQTARLLGR